MRFWLGQISVVPRLLQSDGSHGANGHGSTLGIGTYWIRELSLPAKVVDSPIPTVRHL